MACCAGVNFGDSAFASDEDVLEEFEAVFEPPLLCSSFSLSPSPQNVIAKNSNPTKSIDLIRCPPM